MKSKPIQKKVTYLWALMRDDFIAMTKEGQLFLYFNEKTARKQAREYNMKAERTPISYETPSLPTSPRSITKKK